VFSKYFQDELAYLRELGRDFAQTYPALAPMLADKGGDPDVERLLEGVAFLTGRIRQKLDDELPELFFSISSLLFPQLTRPIPSASVLEMVPLPQALREKRVVPAGAEFDSVPVDGTRCRFTTTADCEVTPLTIKSLRLDALPGGGQQLRIELAVPAGMSAASVAPEKLRLHFAVDERVALSLLLWCARHTYEVAIGTDSPTAGKADVELSLGKNALALVGFGEHDALLPLTENAFTGYRLLTEYTSLPAKFAFVDVVGFSRLAELNHQSSRVYVDLRFDLPLPGVHHLPADAIKLYCVPIVNVFASSAEPITVVPEREQFLVRPAGLRSGQGEVYAITKLQTVVRSTGTRVEVPPFFEFSHSGEMSSEDRVYYSTHLQPSAVTDGADLFVSLGTAEDSGVIPDIDLLSIDLLATNGRLAGALRAGEIATPTASSPPFAQCRNLVAVTPHIPPPLGRELAWRATAHAAMNLRSLAEVDTLRAAVATYNLRAIVDRQAARAGELRVAALRAVRLTPAERLYKGAPVRGVAIEVELDEGGFSGDGDLFLFGAILERLFASYVSINSFARTSVFAAQSKARYTWPESSGSLTLL